MGSCGKAARITIELTDDDTIPSISEDEDDREDEDDMEDDPTPPLTNVSSEGREKRPAERSTQKRGAAHITIQEE